MKVVKKDGWFKMYLNDAKHPEKPSVVYSGTTISGEFVPFVKKMMFVKQGAKAIHTTRQTQLIALRGHARARRGHR